VGFSSHTATRPVRSGFFVLAKLKAAAVTALISCLLTVPAALIWLLLHPDSEVTRALRTLSANTHPLRLTIGALTIFAAIVLLTWTQLVQFVGFQMCGRAWLGQVFLWTGIALAYPIYMGVLWIIEHPEHHQALLQMIPPVIASLAILKVGAGVWIYVAVQRRRLLD